MRMTNNQLALYLSTPVGTVRPNVLKVRQEPRTATPVAPIAYSGGVSVSPYPVSVTVKRQRSFA